VVQARFGQHLDSNVYQCKQAVQAQSAARRRIIAARSYTLATRPSRVRRRMQRALKCLVVVEQRLILVEHAATACLGRHALARTPVAAKHFFFRRQT
jgi:hypothetical protein